VRLGPPRWRHSQRGALGEEPKDVKEAKQPGAEAVEPAVEAATEAEPAAEAEPKAESKSETKAAPKVGTAVVRPPRPLAACARSTRLDRRDLRRKLCKPASPTFI
jgi:hypothetical protein